jgi:hypothetical protein
MDIKRKPHEKQGRARRPNSTKKTDKAVNKVKSREIVERNREKSAEID